MDAGISLCNLGCFRGGRQLFDGVSVTLRPGDALHVKGRNGVGKSSLLRIIAGLLPATGERSVSGDCALMDGRHGLDIDLTLHKALDLWCAPNARGSRDAAIERMGLKALVDTPVRLFSQGQRQRAGLARMMMQDAPIWLLDEPFNGLDHDSAQRLIEAIADKQRAGGIVVIAAHGESHLPDMTRLNLDDHIC